jgi:hypothetical protein
VRIFTYQAIAKELEVFRNYLREFQYGSLRLNAQFYLAECLNSSGKQDEAWLLQRGDQDSEQQFMEQSLIAASSILYDNEDYPTAYDYFERLEKITTASEKKLIAMRGQLRSAYQEGDAGKSILAADRIRNSSNMPEELTREAIFVSAKAHYSLNEFDEALRDFRRTATEAVSIEGAESKYRVAEILFDG